MLLPVHALPAGDVMLTVGGVPPGGGVPPDGGLLTVTVTDAVAVRPAPSVTVRSSVCVPFGTGVVPFVLHAYVAVVPLVTLCVDSVVALSCLRTNCVGEPCALVAAMFTVTVPLTVLPPAGLVIDAVNAGGGVAPPHVAPEATNGDVASLLIVIGAEIAHAPPVSVATAFTSYAPAGSEPVTQKTSPLQVVAPHVAVAIRPPLP